MDRRKLPQSFVQDGDGIWVGSGQDRTPVSYPEHGNESCFELEDRSFWFQHRNECIASIVRRFPPDGPIWDVGGGNGCVARRLIDEGFETVLLEPGPAGALNAKRERGLPTVVCSTLQDIDLEPCSVGAVGLFDVIEHIADDRAFLNHVHSLLRPGGLLYATVPALGWLWSRSDVCAGHYRRYDRSMLDDLLGSRFETLFSTYFFAPLVLPVILCRALPFRLGLGRNADQVASQSEHCSGCIAARGIARLLRSECVRMGQGKGPRVGASCLLVARKR